MEPVIFLNSDMSGRDQHLGSPTKTQEEKEANLEGIHKHVISRDRKHTRGKKEDDRQNGTTGRVLNAPLRAGP